MTSFPLGVSNDDRIVFNIVTSMWEQGGAAAGPAPLRPIFPVFDSGTGPEGLTYKVEVGETQNIVILGQNFTGITTVSVSRDVTAGGSGSAAPSVDSIVVLDTTITVSVNGGTPDANTYWGIVISDAAGNAYAAPSPLFMFSGA